MTRWLEIINVVVVALNLGFLMRRALRSYLLACRLHAELRQAQRRVAKYQQQAVKAASDAVTYSELARRHPEVAKGLDEVFEARLPALSHK